MALLLALLASVVLFASFAVYYLFIVKYFNPLRRIAGPPVRTLFGNHLSAVLDPKRSPVVHKHLVEKYGRSVRIRGVGPWDDRLLTLDPVSLNHVLKNSTLYEKPWQSRRLITSLIGCGMLSAEGQMHKRQRRLATPAFSIQNMRALIPLVFEKGDQLKNRWKDTMDSSTTEATTVDVCQWMSRATFDIIGLAGFDYNFNSIQDESNELFMAYKEMFDKVIGKSSFWGTLASVYFPTLFKIVPNQRSRIIERCQAVIRREAGNMITEKKRKIAEGEKCGKVYQGKDILTQLLTSNAATDIPPEQRIDDEEMLHNINTFMFAGSDTTSLTVSWTLYLLTENPEMQERLRADLLSVLPRTAPSNFSDLTEEETQSVYAEIAELPYLHNVIREALRLIPPLHSTLRVATQDDEIPVSYPVHRRDGSVDESAQSVHIAKGTFVHVSVEAFNLDQDVWGEDAWLFNPDRWDNLPEKAGEQPGLFSNILSFSAGPRSCIGIRFALIEIKTFIFILLTNFVFQSSANPIDKVNVVLTRPFVKKQFGKGSQMPLTIKRYVRSEQVL
ncbi:cytochrome-450 hydroxylase [Lentinula aciculospora]|uniref:Cytochrome-450 hydroxylase n=1 Tax=Lentinula aciculospora TaxID=153920 RepID=A0A9W9DFR8_9AGAR|nr:cytochrome-450 hydroxylase [Lentinula aciculospora]